METLREAVEQLIQAIKRVEDAWEDGDLADAIEYAGSTAEEALDLLNQGKQLPQWKRDLVESRMLGTEPQTVRHVRDEMLKPREYDTAAEAIHEAQVRADREGRTAFVWYRYCPRWAVRDTEPTEADYAEGWMLAARAPARRSRR